MSFHSKAQYIDLHQFPNWFYSCCFIRLISSPYIDQVANDWYLEVSDIAKCRIILTPKKKIHLCTCSRSRRILPYISAEPATSRIDIFLSSLNQEEGRTEVHYSNGDILTEDQRSHNCLMKLAFAYLTRLLNGKRLGLIVHY